MPSYEFYCPDCSHQFELFQKMNDERPTICSECNNHNIYQVWSKAPGAIIDRSKPKTIGDLADKNTERMVKNGELSKDHLNWDKNVEKKRQKSEKMKKIGKMSKDQKTQYILEGKI